MKHRDCADHWCDECKACKQGRCCRTDDPNYRLPELGSVTPFYGELGVRNDWGDKVECHVCGGWFVSVSSHSWVAHDLTAIEYKSAFGLTRRGLISEEYRARMAAVRKANYKGQLSAGNVTAEQKRYARRSLEGTERSRETALQHLTKAPRTPELMARIAATRHKNALIALECAVCGKDFEKVRNRKTKTCSEACRREDHRRWMMDRIARGEAPKPPAMTDEIKKRLSESQQRRWANADGQEREAAKARLLSYMQSLSDDELRAQRSAAGEARASQLRQPHPCTAGCGTIIPTKYPLTCSPECRKKVRQQTAKRALHSA